MKEQVAKAKIAMEEAETEMGKTEIKIDAAKIVTATLSDMQDLQKTLPKRKLRKARISITCIDLMNKTKELITALKAQNESINATLIIALAQELKKSISKLNNSLPCNKTEVNKLNSKISLAKETSNDLEKNQLEELSGLFSNVRSAMDTIMDANANVTNVACNMAKNDTTRAQDEIERVEATRSSIKTTKSKITIVQNKLKLQSLKSNVFFTSPSFCEDILDKTERLIKNLINVEKSDKNLTNIKMALNSSEELVNLTDTDFFCFPELTCTLQHKIAKANNISDAILITQRLMLKQENNKIVEAIQTLITNIQYEPFITTPMPGTTPTRTSTTLLFQNDIETFPACVGVLK
jgi:hypothetical protein